MCEDFRKRSMKIIKQILMKIMLGLWLHSGNLREIQSECQNLI